MITPSAAIPSHLRPADTSGDHKFPNLFQIRADPRLIKENPIFSA
jgi:hypothetical protein